MTTTEAAVPHRQVAPGSDRTFGIVFATMFLVIGLWPIVSGHPPRLWALGFAGALLVAALIAPRLLSPLNRYWIRLGRALHHFINPVVMALVYYGAVVPTGSVLKFLDKDILRLEPDPEAMSYWILRQPPGPAIGSMTRQF